jgi:hypothetical protein
VPATLLSPERGTHEDVELRFEPAGIRAISGLVAGAVGYPLGTALVPWGDVESISIADPPAAEGRQEPRVSFRRTRPAGVACALQIGVCGRTPRAFHVARIGPEQFGGYLMPVFEWLEHPRTRVS